MLLTIMASLAQQESESLSANVRMGIQFRNQQGKVRVNHNRFLGYTKDEDGNLIIDEEQAKIVRRIYREYLEGASVLQIRRGLEADGIENGAGHTRWYESNILQILTNEKYIGDALLQKTYTVDLLAKKRAVNEGQRPQYYVEGCHEAIIDKEVFFRVQTEIERRANFMPGGKRRIYSGKYALSSVLFCGHCGDKFRRIKWNIRGRKTTVWRCASRVEHADCPARTIKEEALHGAVVVAVYDAYGRKAEVIPQLKQNIREVVFEDVDNRMEVISEILSELQQKRIDSPADGDEVERIGGQIEDLRREQQDLLSEVAKRQDLKNRMNEMIAFIEEMPDSVTGYSDTLVSWLIEKIVVYDKKIEVQFKSGLKIDVEV